MKRGYFPLLFLVCLSCVREAKPAKAETITVANIPPAENENPQLVSMLKLSDHANGSKADKISVYDLKMEYGKDSICTRFYKVVFSKNDNAVYEYRGKIVGDPGDWEINENLMAEKKQGRYDRRFVEISNGYPACGYMCSHLLFYLGQGKIGLFKQWKSLWDSGYGSGLEFYPVIGEDGKTDSFSIVKILVDEAPMKDNTEMLEISYSDSVFYRRKGDGWLETTITPKGKIYRKKQLSFNDYHKTGL